MARVWAWLKKWWWTLLLGAVAVAGVVIAIVLSSRKPTPAAVETFSSKAREKIVEAETDAQIAKLKAQVETKEQEAKLTEIAKIEDGGERRRRLADFLDEVL